MTRRLLLAPVLLGQHLSWAHYRRGSNAWDEVAPNLVIGARLRDEEAATLVRAGVTHVLDLTADFDEARPFLTKCYRNLQVLDLTAPSDAQLREAVAFLREATRSGKVYVHCKAGFSRSAAVVGAFLLHEGLAASGDEAVATLRRARPSIIVRPEIRAALHAYSASLRPASPMHA